MNNIIEKKFLAYLMNNKKYIAKVVGKITKNHLPHTYSIYNLINKYFLKYGDIITEDIIDNYFKKRKIDEKTITQYKVIFSEIKQFNNFNDNEFKSILDELEENYKRLTLLNLAETIIDKNVTSCSVDDLNKIQNVVNKTSVELSIDKDNVKEEGSVKDSIKERKEYYEKVKNDPEFLVTYPTGFRHIDDTEGGFAPGELIYIIGRQGDGKSVLLLNLAHNLWYRNYNVILFSIEIPKKDYERRFDARAAGISSNGLKRGTLSEEEEKIYYEYLQKTSEGLSMDDTKVGTLYIVDSPKSVTPAFIETKTKEIETLLNVKFHVIISDYSGIMEPNIRKGEARLDQAEIAFELKQVARSTEKVVISAAQMNRYGKGQKKIESDAMADSDAINNHIDWGIAIRSINKDIGKIETFKTRDASPIEFHFNRKYNKMLIEELDDSFDDWDDV